MYASRVVASAGPWLRCELRTGRGFVGQSEVRRVERGPEGGAGAGGWREVQRRPRGYRHGRTEAPRVRAWARDSPRGRSPLPADTALSAGLTINDLVSVMSPLSSTFSHRNRGADCQNRPHHPHSPAPPAQRGPTKPCDPPLAQHVDTDRSFTQRWGLRFRRPHPFSAPRCGNL